MPRSDATEEQYCQECILTEKWRHDMVGAINSMSPLPAGRPFSWLGRVGFIWVYVLWGPKVGIW
jgi:hypothetical protein